MSDDLPLTATHWGTYRVRTENGRVHALLPFEADADASPIGPGIVDVLDGETRILAPMVRAGWLERGPGSHNGARGREPFVEVDWDTASELVANELSRIINEHGNQAIFGGSYGWASAGRFHHAQGQLHRFLNCIGGYTYSVNTYSFAAAEVAMPHVLGGYREFLGGATSWQSIRDNTELFVAFGGVPLKNGQINSGALGRHVQRDALLAAHAAGVQFINISPLRSDVLADVDAEWLAPRPCSDTALLLGLAHTLLTNDLHDREFLARCCVGIEQVAAYLSGAEDGIAKDADWAAGLTAIPAARIRDLAHAMAEKRTMISVSWSLTRQDHGEQPFWAAVTLAAMLGQVGLPGGGIGFGYSAVNSIGLDGASIAGAALPQGRNPVESFIPVARIADMLLNPGASFDYNGTQYTYPDIRCVYWAGGNPFHHHQDLNRLVRAWQQPDTVIVNEWCWNPVARHADIVLPCTTHLERNDFAMSPRDPFLVAMDQCADAPGAAKNDYDIFSAIAARMGVAEAFTEGRDEAAWLRWLYDKTREFAASAGHELPDYEAFRRSGWFELEHSGEPRVMLAAFRADPDANPLRTPSGRIELYSETVAGFGYDDCPGLAVWREPHEWLGNADPAHPLHLISNQPSRKLHSQLDHGSHSRGGKLDGREPLTLNPADAAARGIASGDTVRVFNERGACFAVAVVSDDVREGVVQLSTGAWFDPIRDGDERGICKHGNPNVLTRDAGTSRLAQGPTAHTCLVELERVEASAVPPVTAFDAPS